MVDVKVIEGDCYERALSKEELNLMVKVSWFLLSLHKGWKLWNKLDTITVEMVLPGSDKLGKVHRGKSKGSNASGCAISETATFRMRANLAGEQALSTIFHEVVHLMWPQERKWSENAVSTLTSRFKPLATEMFNLLMEKASPYKRAAWIAHGQMAYHREVQEDDYNDAQWTKTGVTTKGAGYHPRVKANDLFFENLSRMFPVEKKEA